MPQKQKRRTVMPYHYLFEDSQRPRILISRLSAHGDVVQTLPLLNAIKAHWPEAYIGWLVERSAAPLLEGHPLIDHLHICDRKAWLEHIWQPNAWWEIIKDVWTLQQSIREEEYDVSLDVQGLFKSAIWPWICGIPERFGNDMARERADYFYNCKLPPHVIEDPSTPAIAKYLKLVNAIGVPDKLPEIQFPQFTIPVLSQHNWEKVDTLLSELYRKKGPPKPLIAIAPATMWESKHWEEAHWHTLLRELTKWDVSVAIIGAPQDIELVNRIIPHPLPDNIYDLCGQTSLRDLYALFHRVNILIGPDSAPMHIANAVSSHTGKGPDIIALFGPTASGRTGPIGHRHRVLQTDLECQPCFERKCPLGTHDCMKQLTPTQVLETLKRMLAAQTLFQPVSIHRALNVAPAPNSNSA